MTELGPFFAQADGTLKANPWAWNTEANVIFLEHPVGVGFSYSNDTKFYNDITDEEDAADFYTFMKGWYSQFPEYASNPLWITGESYGGHYVPHFTQKIAQENAAAAAGVAGAVHMNIQGFMVGNAWTVAELDNAGAVFYDWTHGLISDENYLGIFKACNMSNVGPLRRLKQGGASFLPALQMSEAALAAAEAAGHTFDQSCTYYQNAIFESFNNVDIYDIYADVCVAADGTKQLKPQAAAMLKAAGRPVPTGGLKVTGPTDDDDSSATHAADNKGGCWSGYEPCISSYVNTYLNRADVQAAIHARPTQWTDCSNIINYDRTSLLTSMLPVYEYLMSQNLKLLVYSGDVDAIVPITGTRTWIDALNLQTAEPWRPYMVHDQVGGFVQEYKGLTFASVRNAGHLVPGTRESLRTPPPPAPAPLTPLPLSCPPLRACTRTPHVQGILERQALVGDQALQQCSWTDLLLPRTPSCLSAPALQSQSHIFLAVPSRPLLWAPAAPPRAAVNVCGNWPPCSSAHTAPTCSTWRMARLACSSSAGLVHTFRK